MTEQLDLLGGASGPRARQMVLPLPHAPDRAVIPARSNAAAIALTEAWPGWPGPVALLVGPAGSGKSHILEAWAALAGAVTLGASSLADQADRVPPGAAVALDNADVVLTGERAAAAERALFHLINHLRSSRGTLLLASRRPLAAWPVALADLRSRLRGATVAALDGPDDGLMRMVATKLLAERGIEPGPATLDTILARVERSLTSLERAVRRIDEAALSERRRVDRALVRRVLNAG